MARSGAEEDAGVRRGAWARSRLALAVAVLALLALLFAATRMSLQRHECQAFCRQAGYADARYTPGGRGGAPPLCHCLTADEAAQTKRVPPGTQVFPWAERHSTPP